MAKARPTCELRYLVRGDQRVLQQKWERPYVYKNTYGEDDLDYEYEWREVPHVAEDSPTCPVRPLPL